MTASNLHTLPSGQVPVIGLPRTAMGVSNARVLHRRLLVNNVQNNNNNNSLGISSAKRCLFGSPEPGEIQELYREEMRRNRERFLKRYNYDIYNERFVNDDNTVEDEQNSQTNTDNQNSTKLKEYHNNALEDCTKICNSSNESIEERLHEEACVNIEKSIILSSTISLASNSSSSLYALNSNKINCDVTTCNLNDNNDDPYLIKYENLNNNQASQKDFTKSPSISVTTTPKSITKLTTTTAAITLSPLSPRERLKPYSRQILLTDYYNTRKPITSKATTTTTVRQLPKLQKADLHHEQVTTIITNNEQQNHKKQSKQNDEENVLKKHK